MSRHGRWPVVLHGAILSIVLCFALRSYGCSHVGPNESIEELVYLEPLLRRLFIEDDFSFTLFGNKPMSFTGLPYDKRQRSSLGEVVSKQSRSCTKAYEVFENWVHILPTEHYCFVLNKDTEDTVMVYLINKHYFLKVVEDNIDLFRKELGPNITAAGLLSTFQHDSRSVFEILRYREGLLGILLGYGRHNATLFQQREDLIGPLSGYHGKIAHPSYHLMRHPKKITAHQRQLENIEKQLMSFGEEWIEPVLMPLQFPGFGADMEHEETKALAREYKLVLSKILEAYSKQPLRQAVLEQLSRQHE